MMNAHARVSPTPSAIERVLEWFHHWHLLMQYRAADRGKTLALRDGSMVALRHQPRIGERAWVDANGRCHDSSTVGAILDRVDFGY